MYDRMRPRVWTRSASVGDVVAFLLVTHPLLPSPCLRTLFTRRDGRNGLSDETESDSKSDQSAVQVVRIVYFLWALGYDLALT